MNITTSETEHTHTLEPDGPRFTYTSGGAVPTLSAAHLQQLAVIAEVRR